MRRTIITLAAVTLAVLVVVAAPAAGKKGGNKPTTTIPAVRDCSFVGGVLSVLEEGQDDWLWDGTRSVRCRWEVAEIYLDNETPLEFEFVLTGSGRVQIPHLAVTDIYPSGGDVCTNQWEPGWRNLPYSFEPFKLPKVDSPDGCGNNGPDTDGPTTFALTVSPQKIRGDDDDVRLKWLNQVP